MQGKQHKRFKTHSAGTQKWNEQSLLPIGYCYVPATTGYAAIFNMSKNDKKRPWFER